MTQDINLDFIVETKNDKKIIKLKDENLLDKVASEWAEKIAVFSCKDNKGNLKEKKTKKTQVRNFYDKVLELEEEIKKNDFESTYPFIKMLNSKVAYAVTRDVVNCKFQEMINLCLNQISLDNKGEQKFKHFKLFFEAVIGFFKGKD